MIRGPQNAKAKVGPLEKARAAWGNDMPDWVLVLAETCQMSNQATVAKQLDYSGAVVSFILSNSYTGDISRVEQMVRGVLMSETVPCPAIGDLPRHQCLEWQAKPYAVTSSHRVMMYRACRNNCPFSRIGGTKPQGEDA